MAKNKSKKRSKNVHKQVKLSPQKYIKLKARNLPVVKTYVSDGIFETGIGYGIVIREKRNGDKIIGAYLLDVWCLGIKNVLYTMCDTEESEDFLDHLSSSFDLLEEEANYVYNLIYGALEYSEDLGFKPHKDFGVAEYILPHVEEVEYIEITFGKDGKPNFVNGPHDNVGRVLSTLNKSVGEGNFEYIVRVDEEMDYDMVEDNYEDVLESQEYKEFGGMTLVISDIYEEDFDQLKADFVKDKNIVIESVVEFLNEKNNNEFVELPETERKVALACAENLIMYHDVEYINNPEIIGCFKPEGPMKMIHEIQNVSITNFGDLKLEVLCNLFLHMEYDEMEGNEIKFINDSLKLLKTDQNSVFENFSYEAYTVLAALYLHVLAFGDIDYDRIEFKDI